MLLTPMLVDLLTGGDRYNLEYSLGRSGTVKEDVGCIPADR